ncbi:MAG: radical SAM protein [Clostridia bacterium]|nr:radical SAM protein [Clostridia bacterium]
MKKHLNIPVFIPHIGCPNACVFCNQRKISGRTGFCIERIREELNTAFSTIDGTIPVQIAYFGGSFTGIDRADMTSLLTIANEYIEKGKCESIRISTRPDYIDREILDILRAYRVGTVELGIQSTDNSVLKASKRGHTAEDSFRASALVKEYGFELIGQMMAGLPLSSPEKERQTALDIVSMGADGARIYPAVVFDETELADMMKNGIYEPLTTEESAKRAANILSVFLEYDIPVIRIGLQAGETLISGDGVLAGGYHPAVGELAYALYFRRAIEKQLEHTETTGKMLTVFVHPSDVSKTVGQKGMNKEYFINIYNLAGFRVIPDGNLKKNQCRIDLHPRIK